MAAEPHRSNQPQVNGQYGGGGNSDRATVRSRTARNSQHCLYHRNTLQRHVSRKW